MLKAPSMRLPAISVLAFCLLPIPHSAIAQQEKGSAGANASEKSVISYRLEFNVREFDNGKRTNSRNYVMMADNDQWARVRVGNNVPYKSGEGKYEYRNVGMSIDCIPREHEGSVDLNIRVSFSSLAPASDGSPTFNPVFRTNSSDVQSVLVLDKPTVVATMDDVESNRRYEIEVTATKVK